MDVLNMNGMKNLFVEIMIMSLESLSQISTNNSRF